MSHVYNPDNTSNPTAYTHPDDVDDFAVADVNVPLEALADKCEHILTGDCEFSGNKIIASNQIEFVEDLTMNFNASATDISFLGTTVNILFDQIPTISVPLSGNIRSVNSFGVDVTSGLTWYPTSSTIAVGGTYIFPITEIPNRATVEDILLRIDPANDADPTNKIRVLFTRVPLDGTAPTVIGPVVDPLTGAAYQAAHLFEANILLELRLDLFSYYMTILGESGGDADPVTLMCAPALRYSVSTVDLAR